MKTIYYAGDVQMTGTALADAVVHYAESLAQHETSAAIDVPVITESGVVARASFLLGPASQIVAVSVLSPFPDPTDEAVLATIESELAKLAGVPVVAAEEYDDPSLDFDF
jgi:hypothetical protein